MHHLSLKNSIKEVAKSLHHAALSKAKWLRSSGNLGSTVSRCGEPERPPKTQHPWPHRV